MIKVSSCTPTEVSEKETRKVQIKMAEPCTLDSLVPVKVIRINKDSLPKYKAGKNGILPPEAIKAGKPIIRPNTGIRSLKSGYSDLSQSGDQNQEQRAIFMPPKVLKPGTDTLKSPTVIQLLSSASQKGVNPLTGEALKPPYKKTHTFPRITVALAPRHKENAIANLKYLDVEQGLVSSNILSILEDKKGNLWFGTSGGGVTRYDGETFTDFSLEQGLSNDIVRSILEDRNGNIWFGTGGNGVARYNGEEFTIFTTEQGLSNNIVRSILEDKRGILWFGTWGGGVARFDGETFTQFTTEQGLNSDYVYCILEDKRGNLWFGTNGGGVSCFNGETFSNYTIEQGLTNNKIRSILEDKDGKFWFGTDGGGLSCFDGKNFTHITTEQGLGSNYVYSIVEDKNGKLWFGTEDGVTSFDGENFIHFSVEEGLSSRYVRSILEDRNGCLWFGTDGGGISQLNTNNGETFTHFTTNQGLSNNVAFSIIEDKAGNLWFGTRGGGVSRFNGEYFSHFTTEQGLSNNYVLSILEDKKGNLWFGTDGGGVSCFNGETFSNYTTEQGLNENHIRSILEDKNGNIWFGTDGGGVSLYDGESFTHFTSKLGLRGNQVRSIFEDKSGNLWFGTNGGGVSFYDGESVKHLNSEQGLSSNVVSSITEDQHGNIWISTSEKVTILLNDFVKQLATNHLSTGSKAYETIKYEKGEKYEGDIVYLSVAHGLPDNVVVNSTEDNSGNIWIGTRKGLVRLSPADKETDGAIAIGNSYYRLKVYNIQDGFIGGDVFSTNSVAIDSKGNIWWGSGKMVTRYNPEYDFEDTVAISVQLKNIRLYFEVVPWTRLSSLESKNDLSDIKSHYKGIRFDSITRWYPIPANLSLPYRQKHISFNYIAIDLNSPGKTKYQFMLVGLDNDWSPLTGKTEVTFSNLSSGSYTFKVQALSNDGIWSEPLNYRFEIRPPWWSTWWFRTVYILASALALYGIYLWRVSSLEKHKKKLELLVKEKTEELLIQNEEVKSLNDELTSNNEYLNEQNDELESALSSLKETQQQLIQSEKMASLGLLTAGVAHEINNPLNFLMGAQQGLGDYFKEYGSADIPKTDILQSSIITGIDRISDIIKGLNQFSRNNENLDEDCDIHSIIDNCLLMLYNKTKNKAVIMKDYHDSEIVIKGNVGKLHQAFINVLANAVDAIPEMGKLVIKTYILGGNIVVEIIDNGIGIEKKKIPYVTDPFYTTKLPGEGTGLGLSITYSIIKDHKGNLEFESEVNEGTKVKIILPK
jgi:ligand-binding sensor domain-containing protein/signal transduction histidine kinase